MSLQTFRFAVAFLILTAGLFRATPAAAQQPPSERERFHIYVLAGQSNMAGRGTVERSDSVAHPRVWMLTKDLRWVPAVDPMHFDKPIAGVGPGRSFGIVMAEADPGVHIGLIPTAVGGSAMAAWLPGAIHAETGAYPYDEAITRVAAALADGELKGILWHQGESDSNPQAAATYDQNLRALIARFRERLNSPQLPFVIGQLGRFEGYEWNASRIQVDAVQRAIAAAVPNVAYVPSDGLPHNGDGLHFNAAAAREFGRRYAEAYQRLMEQARTREQP
jgi:hypothetical protein